MNIDDLHTGRYYRTLTKSMAALVIFVSVTPLLLISAVSSYQFHYSFKAKVEAHLKEMVQKHQQTIDLFLSEKLGELRLVARTRGFADLSDNARLSEELRYLQEEFSGAFVDIGLINEDGTQQAYAGPYPLANADYSGADWFQSAMESEFYISDVFLGLRGVPHFIIAVRRNWNGKQWILRATIDFMAFNSLVENIRIGRTGNAFIINNAGTFQTGPPRDASLDTGWLLDAMNAQTDALAIGEVPQAPHHPVRSYWASAIMPGKVSVYRHTDTDGVDAIYVSTRLKGGDWILVYRQDVADAFSDLYQTRNIVVFIVLVGTVAIVLMAVLLSRRIVKRIEQADHEKEVMNDQVIEAGKLASIGELAAGIAHEINNPVAIMVEEAGWIGDLVSDDDPTEEDREEIRSSLVQIRTQGARCKEITHKLLSFARKIDPTVHEVNLNDLIREVVSLSDQRTRYGNIDLRLDLQDGLPAVEGSPSELQQVLLNLINNAIDALGTKGGHIGVSTCLENGAIVVTVQDDGEGIPKANLPRIFDPFFTTKPVGKGTGLGLSIIYGIVKKMGGDISVDSEQHVGTVFRVILPAMGEHPEPGCEIPS
ncbi:sensor histidine kinase [Desulfobaculum sp.]|jgi:two-component system NtrC family sensor kinase